MTRPADDHSTSDDIDLADLVHELDEDEDPGLLIRAKWVMDGAHTLTEAADMLRAYADHLEVMVADGYELREPVTDDYGFLQRS